MTESFKKKNLTVIIFEVFVVLIGIISITLATSNVINTRTKTILKSGSYEVAYQGSFDLTGGELEPISDSLVNINTKETVLRAEFSLKGTEKNTEDLVYDIMLKDFSIDTSLLNEYTKWQLYKNGSLLSTGNFSPQFDSDIVTENFTLTNTQEDLPKHNEEYDNYVLIIWISEACEDLTTCNFIDQSDIINSELSLTAFVAVNNAGKSNLVRTPSIDKSRANAPELSDNMIPVYYHEGKWKVASRANGATNSWYNYDNSQWANAVITKDNKYYDDAPGTTIPDEDILSFFVWIPRYKYQVWNINKDYTSSYDAYTKGINIEFEGGLSSSGEITCQETICTGNNNEYLTHPAFGNNLRGFWVSKYEINKNSTFKNNQSILINEDITLYTENLLNFANTYKLNATTKVINNLEWGAITYLSHSKYGLCQEEFCQELGNNDTTISGKNKQDTTTRNVYGVYDMSGSAAEYTTGIYPIGTALEEILLDDSYIWGNSSYTNNNKDYLLRGGVGKSIFTVDDIGMFDISTRMTIIKKQLTVVTDNQ